MTEPSTQPYAVTVHDGSASKGAEQPLLLQQPPGSTRNIFQWASFHDWIQNRRKNLLEFRERFPSPSPWELLLLHALVLFVLMVLLCDGLEAFGIGPQEPFPATIKRTFLSPPIRLGPGQVSNDFRIIDMPSGHVGIVGLEAEMVDGTGTPVPLNEVYLHHWIMLRKRLPADKKDIGQAELRNHVGGRTIGNDGICPDNVLPQFFGLGSETRRTVSSFPAPYVLEAGKPPEGPAESAGTREVWVAQIHAIDTRGVEDAQGCTECNCHLYNVTRDEEGHQLPPDYAGGLLCCYSGTQCRLSEKDMSARSLYADLEPRTYYLRYTVEYYDSWHPSLKPLKVYILDVTDRHTRTGHPHRDGCKVEYTVPACEMHHSMSQCVHTAEQEFVFPGSPGHLVFSVGHQHAGGMGIMLSTPNESPSSPALCDSVPLYGRGTKAGDEAGYIVGMSSCSFPSSASDVAKTTVEQQYKSYSAWRGLSDADRPTEQVAKPSSDSSGATPSGPYIFTNQTLRVRSSYSAMGGHTGVMGLFYLAIADEQ